MNKNSQAIIRLEEKGEIEYDSVRQRYVWCDNDNADDFTVYEVMGTALIEEGFAFEMYVSEGQWYVRTNPDAHNSVFDSVVDPFAQTVDGYEEAHALEDWLATNYDELWDHTATYIKLPSGGSYHRWRLRRIYKCFQQLRDGEQS